MKLIYAARKYDSLGRPIADPPKQIFNEVTWKAIPKLTLGLEGEGKEIMKQGWVEISKQEFEGRPISIPEVLIEEKPKTQSKALTVAAAKKRIQAVKDGERLTASDILEALAKLKDPIEGAEFMPFSALVDAVKELEV